MKMYWPMAEYKQMEQSALPTRLFTYTASDTMKEAREVIRKWANECDFHLTSAWIDCMYDNDRKRRIRLF